MNRMRINQLDIAWTASGQGQPVILVHGSWDTHAAWDRVAPELAQELRVIRYDRRGHGESECPPGQGRYSEDVDDLCQLIEAMSTDTGVHLIGHSYGATIALLAADQCPERVGSVLVHEPPAFGLLKQDQEHKGLLPIIQRHIDQAMAMLEKECDAEGARYFADHIGFGPGFWDSVLTADMRASFIAHAPTWLDQARDPTRLDIVPERFSNLRVPVCLTTGTHGLPWYAPTMARLARLIPDARLVTVPGAGHAPHLTHPHQWAQLALDFIGKH
ncbi:MAG: alpha/beta fold hydrolase [Halomonadaceae bacterium]|jgi:pimeloyl-ACP methyl ester carboxylesterase|uniref:alpha/beta fold hydrolase n=1 Tax=Halomonas sp. MCCC 1A11062 TaxID=2733485 RepID=UPI001F37B559|nr:alpha/beta hydrolase [Halomonas sp. MCCC 1A11062]MCE8037642.1 alpha/beta hydrolase [Halomonas sp. MCCC 1A11062]